MITLLSVNAVNFYGSDDRAEQARFAGLEMLIRARNPDVVVVQEIISAGEDLQAKRAGAVAGLRPTRTVPGRGWTGRPRHRRGADRGRRRARTARSRWRWRGRRPASRLGARPCCRCFHGRKGSPPLVAQDHARCGQVRVPQPSASPQLGPRCRRTPDALQWGRIGVPPRGRLNSPKSISAMKLRAGGVIASRLDCAVRVDMCADSQRCRRAAACHRIGHIGFTARRAVITAASVARDDAFGCGCVITVPHAERLPECTVTARCGPGAIAVACGQW